ncbi:MAG: hypothetical protein ACK5D5_07220 [Bacteroidota bacterium]|jgi:hypothetical protein
MKKTLFTFSVILFSNYLFAQNEVTQKDSINGEAMNRMLNVMERTEYLLHKFTKEEREKCENVVETFLNGKNKKLEDLFENNIEFFAWDSHEVYQDYLLFKSKKEFSRYIIKVIRPKLKIPGIKYKIFVNLKNLEIEQNYSKVKVRVELKSNTCNGISNAVWVLLDENFKIISLSVNKSDENLE